MREPEHPVSSGFRIIALPVGGKLRSLTCKPTLAHARLIAGHPFNTASWVIWHT